MSLSTFARIPNPRFAAQAASIRSRGHTLRLCRVSTSAAGRGRSQPRRRVRRAAATAALWDPDQRTRQHQSRRRSFVHACSYERARRGLPTRRETRGARSQSARAARAGASPRGNAGAVQRPSRAGRRRLLGRDQWAVEQFGSPLGVREGPVSPMGRPTSRKNEMPPTAQQGTAGLANTTGTAPPGRHRVLRAPPRVET